VAWIPIEEDAAKIDPRIAFLTPDRDGRCKIGEFVYYQLQIGDAQRRVLGRITRRAPVRLFPDSFMASPDVSPAEVAAALGYLDGEDELFEVTVLSLILI